jgi:hypothetical protein
MVLRVSWHVLFLQDNLSCDIRKCCSKVRHIGTRPPIYAWVYKVVTSPQLFPQNAVYFSSLPIRATCPVHLILLDFITCTIVGEKYR